MITFTPLSGAAGSSRTVPLAYLLQVDDVRILLDCGSPDWCPEKPAGDVDETEPLPWEKYCDELKECVFRSVNGIIVHEPISFCVDAHPQ